MASFESISVNWPLDPPAQLSVSGGSETCSESTDARLQDLIGQGVKTYVSNLWECIPRIASAGDPGQFGAAFLMSGSSNSSGTVDYKGALYAAAETGANGDHVYGFNALAQWNPRTPKSLVIGAEVNVNNHSGSDVTPGQWPLVAGISVYSGGTNYARAGLWVDSAIYGGRFRNAVELPRSGWVDAGLRVGSPDDNLRASVVVRQGGSDISDSIVSQRSINAGTLFRAMGQDQSNLAIVWWEGSIWSAANIVATQDVYARGLRCVREDELKALANRVHVLESR